MKTDSRVLGALRIAARRVGDDEPDTTFDSDLRWIVRCAVETVAPAAGGGITRTSEGTVRSGYTTGEDIEHLDRLQSDLGQGPCVSAADSPARDGVIHARDLGGADRDVWPAFAPQAVALGYRSMLSLRLCTEPDHGSALNLYARDPNVFDDASVFTATAFSLQAGVLLHGEKRAENLRRALETRDLISQAKGVLMERFNLGSEKAFRLLVTASQESNVKLAEVAQWLLTDADRTIRQPADTPSPVERRLRQFETP